MRQRVVVAVMLALLVVGGPWQKAAQAQTGDVTVVVAVNGLNADVSLYLQRTGGTAWKLGVCSFVFNFNNTAMTYSGELVEGRWDNNTSGFYGDQFSSSYSSGTARSIEIDFTGDGSLGEGTDVPTSATLLGTLRFAVSNPNANHNVTWDASSSFISDNQGNDLGPTGLNNIVFSDPTNSPLPVQLAAFTVSIARQNQVRLEWTTLTETNNYGFEVQKSRDGKSEYQTIPNSFVAGHGTTLEPHTYGYTDASADAGTSYYRLKQIDLDGTTHYSDGMAAKVVTDVRELAPVEFRLHQNYPNPFNPTTELKFSVETLGRATLHVYSITGQEVAKLFDDIAEPGRYYKVRLEGGNLASGMYFYRLQSGSKSNVRKLILLK